MPNYFSKYRRTVHNIHANHSEAASFENVRTLAKSVSEGSPLSPTIEQK